MQVFLILAFIIGGGSWYFLSQPVFGRLPEGKRMDRIIQSPNYKGGKFVNQEHTPDLAPGVSVVDILGAFISRRDKTEPSRPIPSIRTDLKVQDTSQTRVVWFGHSSYLVQSHGVSILVDPVFSGNASPVGFFAKSFPGSDVYQVDDFPSVDVLLITHDHYDHLDYKTIVKLKGKFKKIVTSLGVGAHLNYWGIPDEQIMELDWGEKAVPVEGYTFTATPARHFSGRKFTRAQSIWSSFVLQTPFERLFLGGDSGYGKHFSEIGKQYGPFDLAILECGQYNDMWPYIHMKPEDVVKASKELNARVLMPVHWSKFSLALHPWNEPIQRVTTAAQSEGQKITTPLIGEELILNKVYPDSVWWNF